jgi:hypothetical protein
MEHRVQQEHKGQQAQQGLMEQMEPRGQQAQRVQ